MTKPIEAPFCCKTAARLTDGKEIYPHRFDLFHKAMWKCDACGAYISCHQGTTRPLGTPAGPELRRAREKLHNDFVDPLWKNADSLPEYSVDRDEPGIRNIRKTARYRIYGYMGERLGLTKEQCHIAMFDLEMVHKAVRIMAGVTYAEIRQWAHDKKGKAAA